MSHAYEGYAQAKGIKNGPDEKDYPDDKGREALRAREVRERGDA